MIIGDSLAYSSLNGLQEISLHILRYFFQLESKTVRDIVRDVVREREVVRKIVREIVPEIVR